MAACCCRFLRRSLIPQNLSVNVARKLRGMPPGLAKTLAQRLAELNAKDAELDAKVDIGLPPPRKLQRKHRMAQLEQWKEQRREDSELAEQHRLKTLLISLDSEREEWRRTERPRHLKNIADHYGIYDDLFQHGIFMPYIFLDIFYDYDDTHVTPVHQGNIILPSQAKQVPHVQFEAPEDSLWTLILTNPDGHLLDNESEYVHWFIGNIRGNDLTTGEILYDYMQPFPPRGTGYHRMIFILYKQEEYLDYSALKKPIPCLSLRDRTFKTFDFYKLHQDSLTPTGLAFFQSTWDESLKEFFHHTLQMREPVYEYCYPEKYVRPQVKTPHKQPFNLYLDRYRDPKEIRKEVLLKRLQSLNPFEEEPPFPKYPNIYRMPRGTPSWLKPQIVKERNRVGKFRDLRPYSSYPAEDDV